MWTPPCSSSHRFSISSLPSFSPKENLSANPAIRTVRDLLWFNISYDSFIVHCNICIFLLYSLSLSHKHCYSQVIYSFCLLMVYLSFWFLPGPFVLSCLLLVFFLFFIMFFPVSGIYQFLEVRYIPSNLYLIFSQIKCNIMMYLHFPQLVCVPLSWRLTILFIVLGNALVSFFTEVSGPLIRKCKYLLSEGLGKKYTLKNVELFWTQHWVKKGRIQTSGCNLKVQYMDVCGI